MLSRLLAALACVTVVACSPAASAAPATPTAVPSVAPATAPTATQAAITSEIVGSWHRAQTCEEMRVKFEAAGLAESHRDWLQGNFFGGEPGPTSGDPCAGAQGPIEHSHFFTADGQFGSHDESGEQVDDGDYAVIDDRTLAFPSHSAEFGYSGEIFVGYAVVVSVVSFEVRLPGTCDDPCKQAYAWALSAFASGVWLRGEIPT